MGGRRACCVPGCISRKNKHKVSFFSIPSPRNNKGVEVALKRRRHEAWLKAIGRADLTGTKLQYERICSIHFIREDYDTHPDWVPSMYLKSQDMNEEKYNKSLKKMEEFKREKDKQRRNLLQSLALEHDSILMRLLLSTAKGYEYETPLSKKNNVELRAEEFVATELTEDVETNVGEFETIVVKEENVEPNVEEFDATMVKEEIIETKVKIEDNIAPSNEEEHSETILGI